MELIKTYPTEISVGDLVKTDTCDIAITTVNYGKGADDTEDSWEIVLLESGLKQRVFEGEIKRFNGKIRLSNDL